MSIGDQIRKARLARGLTQVELAQLCGTNQPTIDRLERGKTASSKHLPAIAQELGIQDALLGQTRKTVPVVGYIGAGAVVWPIDDHQLGNGLDEIDAPPGVTSGIALRVRGDSMYPKFEDGDIVVCDDVPRSIESLINRVCYVKLTDGRAYLKILRRGSSPGRWSLHSHNAPPIDDVEVDQAYRVVWVRPA